MMISACVAANSCLVLEPSRALSFMLEPTKSVTTILSLSNISRHVRVVFKIRTTNPAIFTVQPSCGVVQPGSKLKVRITLVEYATETIMRLPANERSDLREKFLVQSFGSKAREIEDFDMYWRSIPKKSIVNKKLKCNFFEQGMGMLCYDAFQSMSSKVFAASRKQDDVARALVNGPVASRYNPAKSDASFKSCQVKHFHFQTHVPLSNLLIESF